MTPDDDGAKTGGRIPRRRLLTWAGGIGVASIGAGATALTPSRANAYYSGPVTDHFDGVRFYNPSGTKPKGFRQLAKWQFGERSAAWPPAFPSPHADTVPAARLAASETRVTFIGHASYLVQTAGLNILFDPVYAERASPFRFVGPKRVNPPGIALDSLPPIDLLLVSHNHYDHLDTTAIATVWRRHRPRIVTPLGNDAIIAADVPEARIEALDWHHGVDLGSGARLDCVPTQHWSARGTRDRMHALWASFVVSGPRHTLYIVGDSGFGDGRIFRDVAARHPRIDLALLPIGAYEPRWFMRDQHMNPDDAVQALQLCGAARAIGHHWGTFKLTNEAIDAPREDLAHALARHAVARERFVAVQPGAVVTVA